MAEQDAGVTNRIVAKMIDLSFAFLVAALLPKVIGPLIGFIYSICADGIHLRGSRGQSLGKKILKIQVINQVKKKPATFKDSIIRNAPVGSATFFGIIPVWGWVISILVGVPILTIEVYLMIRVKSRERLGDLMADTRVIVYDPPKVEKKKKA